jgi:hypothetical protein
MTFEVGEAINYIIDAFLKAPIVNSIARNHIYTALAVTIVIMIIIMIVFRDIDADETLFTMSLRSGFWIFIMLLGVLMIHNRVFTAETSNVVRDGQYDKVFTPSPAARLEGEFVPVRAQPQQYAQNLQPQQYAQVQPTFANVRVD